MRYLTLILVVLLVGCADKPRRQPVKTCGTITSVYQSMYGGRSYFKAVVNADNGRKAIFRITQKQYALKQAGDRICVFGDFDFEYE